MKRKIIYILLFAVSILSLLVGCGKEDKEEAMGINLTEVTMKIGEVVTLEVSNASGTVVISSSNESVVTVNNGEITAVAAGTATITVSDDDESLSCIVTVLAQEYDGVHIISVVAETVDLIVGDEYQLEPKLLRGLDIVAGVEFQYTSIDESVVTVQNGKIKALKAGETFVQIDAVNYSKTSKTIKVIVKDDFTIDLSQGDIVLSKMELLDYVTSKEVSFVVKENGNVLDVDNLEISVSDESVVSVEMKDGNYLIKALGFGDAKVSFSYQKNDGSVTTSYVNVEVVKPVVELDSDYYFSKVKGLVNFAEFDFEAYNLTVDATQCSNVSDEFGNVFPILSKTNSGVVIDSTSNIDENGASKKMYYDMSEYILAFDIIQCTLAIRTVDDFLSMQELVVSKRADDGLTYKRVDGYVALVNDLDFTGIEYTPFCGYNQIDRVFAGRSGWNAIFEGNNKVIKNLKLGSDTVESKWNSIFGNVGWDAQIRNLAIVDCTFGAKATGAVLADYFHGKASNIFISATINTGYGLEIENTCSGFSIATPYKNAIIENVTIVIKNELPEKYNNVISGGPVSSTFEGTYNLSNAPIKSMVCIGGGDFSKLLIGFDSIEKIIQANGPTGYIIGYETINEALEAVIADNGSTSFSVVDDKLQIKFNGVVVYNS